MIGSDRAGLARTGGALTAAGDVTTPAGATGGMTPHSAAFIRRV